MVTAGSLGGRGSGGSGSLYFLVARDQLPEDQKERRKQRPAAGGTNGKTEEGGIRRRLLEAEISRTNSPNKAVTTAMSFLHAKGLKKDPVRQSPLPSATPS